MRQENKEWWYSASVRPEDWQIREAVRLYEEEGWTQKEIGKKFNRAQSAIHRWITKFAKDLENPKMSNNKRRDQKRRERAKRKFGITAPDTAPVENSVAADNASSPSEVNNASEKELKARIARLERELEDARLMRDFYDEMINVAEKDFNIPIRKKGGAKR